MLYWLFWVVSQVDTFGANNPLTNLVPSLQDVDPDDAFSSVPYEKGFALLYHLEELMGGPGNTCLQQQVPQGRSIYSVCSLQWSVCVLRGVHGVCKVVHPAVRLQQRHYWRLEELPVHILQRQGEKNLDALRWLWSSLNKLTGELLTEYFHREENDSCSLSWAVQ